MQVEGVDWGPAGPALRSLRRYLEGERWAVFNFLFTVLDEVHHLASSLPGTKA